MQPAGDGPPRSGGPGGGGRGAQLRRYGPLAVIAVLLVGIGVVTLTGGGNDDGGATGAGARGAGAAGVRWAGPIESEPGAPEPVGSMPVTYAEAEEEGTLDEHEWPASCDTGTGDVAIPSVYAMPCVPAFKGDNGGATATGVTADAVRVVYYAPEQSADLSSLLTGMGANDPPEQRVQTLQDYVEIWSSAAELSGRRIEVVPYAATGTADDVVAARADATEVIALEPFAVIGGPGLDRGTFAEEVAGAGILCLECTGVLPDATFLEHAPYLWGALPSPNQFLELLRVWSEATDPEGPAEFAGEELRDRPRRYGVIHFEQDPPMFEATTGAWEDRFVEAAAVESYVLDFPSLPAKATEAIARFKAEEITTVAFLGDPIMPSYLMEAATEQEYEPEWVFAGTALTDTNIFGRTWEPTQMEHAFGMSQVAAPMTQDLQETVRLYRWYFGGGDTLPPAENLYNIIAPSARWLVAGIHMAGPELTPETFARGLFRIPPKGGGPGTPSVSYGNWGRFPDMDYHAFDDAAEIWWDPTVEAEDERGVRGRGVWRRTAGAARFTTEETPESNLFADAATAATVLDELPEADRIPDHPPPPGSPAAG